MNPQHPVTGQFQSPDVHAMRDARATNAQMSADLQRGADERAQTAPGHVTPTDSALPTAATDGGFADLLRSGGCLMGRRTASKAPDRRGTLLLRPRETWYKGAARLDAEYAIRHERAEDTERSAEPPAHLTREGSVTADNSAEDIVAAALRVTSARHHRFLSFCAKRAALQRAASASASSAGARSCRRSAPARVVLVVMTAIDPDVHCCTYPRCGTDVRWPESKCAEHRRLLGRAHANTYGDVGVRADRRYQDRTLGHAPDVRCWHVT